MYINIYAVCKLPINAYAHKYMEYLKSPPHIFTVTVVCRIIPSKEYYDNVLSPSACNSIGSINPRQKNSSHFFPITVEILNNTCKDKAVEGQFLFFRVISPGEIVFRYFELSDIIYNLPT